MLKPRVLIVENEVKWRRNHELTVKALGYEPVVAEGMGDDLIEDAIAKCMQFCCHVAIVDLRLRRNSDMNDESGIDEVGLIIAITTTVLIVSGHFDVNEGHKFDEKTKPFGLRFDYVSKNSAHMTLPKLIEHKVYLKSSVAKGISLKVAKTYELQVDQFLARMGYGDDIAAGKEVLTDLLVDLYKEAKGFVLGPIDASLHSSSASVARNSLVGLVKLDGLSRMDAVIKFARPEAIRAEYDNYIKHIYRHVPWQSYAGLDEKIALLHRIGAIGLDLVLHAAPFSSLYGLVSDETVKPILDAIEYFSDNWTHYTEDKSPKQSLDSTEFIDNLIQTWDKNKHDSSNTFASRLAETDPERMWKEPVLAEAVYANLELSNPIFWLKRKKAEKYPVSNEQFHLRVTHGDAWAENLFVTKLGTAIWIDYERTGMGYVLQDFARLEFDILTRLIRISNDENEWRILFHLYVEVIRIDEFRGIIDLLSPNKEIRKAVLAITKIRQEAARHAQSIVSTRQYLTALLINAVFRATLKPPQFVGSLDAETSLNQGKALKTWELERQRAMLLGGLIADKFESHRKHPWPNPNWSQPITQELLRRAIAHHSWTAETIQSLMFDVLDKSPDDFGGDTLRARMMHFYRACEETGKLGQLLSALLKLFPKFPQGFNLG